MRFFGLVLVSVGLLGAVMSIAIGVIDSLSAAPGATANAAVIFAILAAAAFAGGAAFFAGGMVCTHMKRQHIYFEHLLEVAGDNTDAATDGPPREADRERASVVRLGGPGPRATAF